eukprot:CAMPEP_0194519414 /NCGR_PEP_ID=MMETSP0253-20130528/53066_1 /TAXON_ID=2966 /ORGANISM="Noctiluca scintillans" /LENGTH=166 /DNA_ID=CAMNT_0039363549 /DNA_START=341 /DNA_END=841 /DNA_ORIENTATION=-
MHQSERHHCTSRATADVKKRFSVGHPELSKERCDSRKLKFARFRNRLKNMAKLSVCHRSHVRNRTIRALQTPAALYVAAAHYILESEARGTRPAVASGRRRRLLTSQTRSMQLPQHAISCAVRTSEIRVHGDDLHASVDNPIVESPAFANLLTVRVHAFHTHDVFA